ncbi:Bro-N domain-containing protein [Streptomyces caniscabiei]|uniref:Bro-N domain-containing protein n=1 Tax=Streptomyces caniscabiei TaxID=2746961 RepID=A0A927L3D5_9ACTN|nr:Bro-N domain-containing protein [Streptomyces caniscabiei]MBD9724594.1 Bro-N domain-containing protein [Streptomyces caniscabiei]MDX3508008.1 Bro-N domain-containing protein [Streptomyces caniscabiei]MDX3717970.1 Bro-N domain-containing protein [Streptomyces caniscabiei]WEO25694.1 Bro-N domain-containing protein [Streptomyces caniscabiei]
MIEPSKHQPDPRTQHDAIDVGDFVYAATGARVRRLTMPDGTHWFPAVDVCKQLGYTTPRKALIDHVPEAHREILETLTGGHGLSVPAGREWRRDLNLIDLQGLILLVSACTKPECAPFKQWVAEVIETVQREGSYALDEAEVQPVGPGAPIAYAMPEQIADAIVRLEERNLQADEQLAVSQQKSLALQQQMLDSQQHMSETQQQMVEMQRAGLAAQQAMALAMERIANRLDTLAVAHPAPTATAFETHPTTESVPADWRERLSVTTDVWTVAVVIAPVLVEEGELRQPLEAIAARTGLSVHRVNECLRLLRKHACIHPVGAAEDGAPVYVLHQR